MRRPAPVAFMHPAPRLPRACYGHIDMLGGFQSDRMLAFSDVANTMPMIRLQYLPTLSAWVAPLQDALADLDIEVQWVQCELSDLLRVNAADLLLVDKAFADGDFTQVVTRQPTLLLLESCVMPIACHWMKAGFDACLSMESPEPTLNHILAYYFRKLSRRKLVEHKNTPELLQAVVDAVPLPVFFKDQDGLYLGGNREFERYIGKSLDELQGKTVYYIGTPELADVYAQADRDLLANGGIQQYETQCTFADGSLRDVEFHKAVFYQKDGSVGGQVGVLLDITERKRLAEQLTRQANTDPLTGALNLRSFYEMAERQLNLVRRHAEHLSILVLDADHFKRINDVYGHAGGDAVLRSLVTDIQPLLRREDALFRVGGEEFYALLPRTELEKALDVAERLRAMVEHMVVGHSGRQIRLTVSIGAAEIKHDETIQQCLHRADKALYEAKGRGRNRVMLEAC